jgi:alkylhydroperoxidase family enzyme
MTGRIGLLTAAPNLAKEWQKAIVRLAAVANFDPTVAELVKLRASQINGCANCITCTRSKRGKGRTRAAHLPPTALAQSPLLLRSERAALEWTEALTRLSEGYGVP